MRELRGTRGYRGVGQEIWRASWEFSGDSKHSQKGLKQNREGMRLGLLCKSYCSAALKGMSWGAPDIHRDGTLCAVASMPQHPPLAYAQLG